MPQIERPPSIIDSLGEELIRIITPVTICMFLVVILVAILNSDSSLTSISMNSIATIAYSETTSDSFWDKLEGAVLNAIVFVVVVTLATFLLVLLFYCRCTQFLKYYMGFSSFIVLGFLGGEVALILIRYFSIPIDCITFAVVLFNFSVVGVLAVFMSKMVIFVTQAYLVVIGVLVAYWFTLLPEWTTWTLLVALALYDLAAVLLPVGPLRILVELAIARDEDIPALVYEARPVTRNESETREGVVQRRVWRERGNVANNPDDNLNSDSDLNSRASRDRATASVDGGVNDTRLVNVEEGQVSETTGELTTPLLNHSRPDTQPRSQGNSISTEDLLLEGVGLGSSGAIKLGLGDFIFYSVLVGRAAMYDFMTVYACYFAIIAGLAITLLLLAVYQKALPALPVSIALGVLFYFLVRYLLEVFVVQCSLSLLMF